MRKRATSPNLTASCKSTRAKPLPPQFYPYIISIIVSNVSRVIARRSRSNLTVLQNNNSEIAALPSVARNDQPLTPCTRNVMMLINEQPQQAAGHPLLLWPVIPCLTRNPVWLSGYRLSPV